MVFPTTTRGRIFAVLVLLLLGAILFLLIWWSGDPALEADVVKRDCQGPLGENSVTAKTRMFGIERTVPVEYVECGAIPPGAFVVYHLRSARTIVYEFEGGPCVYDSLHTIC